MENRTRLCFVVVLGAQMSRMCDESTTRSKKEERTTYARRTRQQRTNTNKNERHNTLSRVFAFAGETKRDDTHYIRFSFTRARAQREEYFERSETKHTLGEKSRQIKKFLRKKKKERRKATNTTNEDEG